MPKSFREQLIFLILYFTTG